MTYTTGHGQFDTTHWSVVLTAAGPDFERGRRSIATLYQAYLRPLYAYARRQGKSRENAMDLTQGFFERLLEKNSLAGVRPQHGRFRSFLLAAFKHFMTNEWHHDHRQKRDAAKTLSLDDPCFMADDPPDHLTPDKAFDRQWALTVIDRVMETVAVEWVATNKAGLFQDLKPFLEDKKATPHAELAIKYHISENAISVAISRLRKQYRTALLKEIARTVNDPAEVEDELRFLIAALSS